MKLFRLFVLWAAIAAAPAAHAEVGGRFMLWDAQRNVVTDADFNGKFMLITFGYTFCPDICPTNLSVMGRAMELLGDKADEITPIFISVDPERDTPGKLGDYVANFHDRFVGLTGSEVMIKRVADSYKVVFAKVPSTSGDPSLYTVDHTASIFLMAPDGHFLDRMAHGITAEQMAERVRGFVN
ncbi:MAG: SCO family protein [Alphaproteobacteria bacterium]|nr:SCO family protein [Alphaproteobacteria bacterium]